MQPIAIYRAEYYHLFPWVNAVLPYLSFRSVKIRGMIGGLKTFVKGKIMNELKSQVLLEKVLQIAHQAGDYLNLFYNGEIDFQINIKSDNTPITNADLFVNQVSYRKTDRTYATYPCFIRRKLSNFFFRSTAVAYLLVD